MTNERSAGPERLVVWRSEVDLGPYDADFAKALEIFWENYVDPETGIIYDAPMKYAEVWPTPEEVAANIPTLNGWDTAIENAPGEGGPMLAGLALDAFALTEARRRECLDHILKGLVALWDVPGRTGFICRGFLRDTRSFYVQTSWDQVPIYLYGLWCYHRSRHCTDAHRRQLCEIFDSVLRWLEHNGWDIRLYRGEAATHGGMAESTDPGIARLFAILLMGHDVTGDARWREAYRLLRDEDGRRRFGHIGRRDKVWQPYTAFYQAFSLWALEQLDDDRDCRAFYAAERRQFIIYACSFCANHIYARFSPVGRDESQTINTLEDRLIDWRPAWEATRRDPGAGEPAGAQYWYNYRNRLEQMRADAGLRQDGWTTYDFFTLLGTYALAQGHPAKWAYYGTAECLRCFFRRLSFENPLRFLPKLAFALGLKGLLGKGGE